MENCGQNKTVTKPRSPQGPKLRSSVVAEAHSGERSLDDAREGPLVSKEERPHCQTANGAR